jgi:hypothetical protein
MKATIIAENRDDLRRIIKEQINLYGLECDLNHVDVSQITDMSFIFSVSHFNNDISRWNVSNVKEMAGMFSESAFNGDISQWDVSKVECMQAMFSSAKFDKDISNWTPFKLEEVRGMFYNSRTPIPYWAECKNFEREKLIKKYQFAKELNNELAHELNENKNNESKLKI